MLLFCGQSRSIYLNLFSETNYKKPKIFLLSFYHSLALHTELEKTLTPTLLDWGWLYDILDMDDFKFQNITKDKAP